jgi:hypothetical protein
MRRHRFALAAMAVLILSPVLSQRSFAQRRGPAPPSNRPVPRTPDGKVNFGSNSLAEQGTWTVNDNRIAIPEKPEETGDRDSGARPPTGPGAFPKPKMSEIPFQPSAKQ